MNRYTILPCSFDKITKVQNFIDDQWKRGHILATNTDVLDWQYYDVNSSTYNFIIAVDAQSGSLVALLGFIPTNHFDVKLEQVDLWGAVWKVLDGVDSLSFKNGKIMGLGASLLDYLIDTKKVRSYGAIGINKRVAKLYEYLGFSVSRLNHYYIVNREKCEFSILNNFDGIFCADDDLCEDHEVKLISSISDLDINADKKILPVKSNLYFVNRYLKHPFYDYTLLRIANSRAESCVLVYRVVKVFDAKAIRIVDFWGNPSAILGAKNVFYNLLQEYDAEYIDFYNYGLSEDVLKNAGFILRNSTSSIVVPNYFEPFERRNIDILFAYKVFTERPYTYVVCKGDADQDRPNFL